MRTSLLELPAELTEVRPLGDVRYLLGVDGGATKTLAAVLDLERGAVHVGHGGPSNEDAVGTSAAVQALLEAADEAIATAGIEERELGSAVLAIAGTDTHAVAGHVREARTDAWLVVNDVVGAWATATGAGPGVAAISGTGSNVFGVGPAGATWRAGGWGHVLGDEGSGYWLGAHSISAALRDRDGSGPATALSDALPAFFEVASVEELANLVYSKPLSKGEIAAFGARAAEIAEAGDAVAIDLFRRGAQELANQILAVIERTRLDGAFPLGLTGSGFKAGALLVQPLAELVHQHSPEAAVEVVQLAPVGGSLLLAARACGHAEELPREQLATLLDAALEGQRG
jgi:N-acetylglucosamine kinase-like BadF-type ATPase